MSDSAVTALIRDVSPAIGDCALTYMERAPIDVDRATEQHRTYAEALRCAGADVVHLPPLPDMPDGVFVEDTAVVLDEIAVIACPRLPSRRPETASTADVLRSYRPLQSISGEGSLEGGDVMRVGRTIFVGLSQRTNREGIAQLEAAARPYDYRVVPVDVRGCLHLKTACTSIGNNTVLANPAWVDVVILGDVEILETDPAEPFAANALPIGDVLLFPATFPRTQERLEARGFRVQPVDNSELQKAEAGLTCCSIVFQA